MTPTALTPSCHPSELDTDHDGMADAGKAANGHDPKDGRDHATDADGYTDIEEYLGDLGI